jgi:ribosomal protein S2
MADIINLRQARKSKARSEKETKAAENRRLHGRTKQEKMQARQDAAKLNLHLDGHKLDTSKPSKPD